MNQSVTIDVSNAHKLNTASPLKVWQRRLTIILLIQLLLILGVFAYKQNAQISVDAQPLLGFKAESADRLIIEAADSSVSLQKNGDAWQLPDYHQLPLDQQKLDELLKKLESIQLTWPVATTVASHERFEVADNKFQRRIQVYQGDTKQADFWLGSSPSFKKVHLRREGENAIYAVDLTAFEFAVVAKDWLQTDLLAVQDASNIKAPDYELQKAGDNWNFVNALQGANSEQGTNSEKVNPSKATELVKALGALQVQEAVEQVPQGETTQFTVKSAAGEFNFTFTKAGSEYFVSRSDRNVSFKLSQVEFERIVNVNKAALKENDSDPAEAKTDPVADLTNLNNLLNK